MGFWANNEVGVDKHKNTHKEQSACGDCKLYKSCTSPRLEPFGVNKTKLMIILEQPSKADDIHEVPYTGKSGKLLEAMLKSLGINVASVVTIFANRCHTTKEVELKQVEACKPNVWKAIKRYKPHVIIPMGRNAIASLFRGRIKYDSSAKLWRGFQVPDRRLKAWVCPTFSVRMLAREGQRGPDVVPVIMKQDIKIALALLQKPLPVIKDERECVEILTKPRSIKAYLKELVRLRSSALAFDYETTGLKPHAPGHKIYSLGICHDYNHAVSFMWNDAYKDLWGQVLTQPRIPKIVAGMRMEMSWSKHKVGVDAVNIVHDVNLAQHVIDNRGGSCSVKFISFMMFGLESYDDAIGNHFEAKEGGANGINNIHLIKPRDLCLYGGIDALVEYRIALRQKQQLGLDW